MMGEIESQLTITHHQPNEVSSTAIGLQLVKLLGKEAPQESPNYPRYCQDYILLCTIC